MKHKHHCPPLTDTETEERDINPISKRSSSPGLASLLWKPNDSFSSVLLQNPFWATLSICDIPAQFCLSHSAELAFRMTPALLVYGSSSGEFVIFKYKQVNVCWILKMMQGPKDVSVLLPTVFTALFCMKNLACRWGRYKLCYKVCFGDNSLPWGGASLSFS